MKYWHRRIHLVTWIIMLVAMSAAFIFFIGVINNNNLQSSSNATANNATELPKFIEWEEELDTIKEDSDQSDGDNEAETSDETNPGNQGNTSAE